MSANTYLTPSERAVLEAARVGIAGAGGLGSNCAMHLVRAGVRHLTVVDFDVVNESNLNRQFFFRDQLGLKKVEALKANLLRIDPGADIRSVDLRLAAASARESFADCDIVVEAFDVVEAKAMLVAALAPSGKRIVTASGLAGWGRSNAMQVRRMGNIVAVGDGETAVGENTAPASPRVGIAAAMQANSVVAMLLGEEL
jgi:sulfur carrier protein ThiS adenylyltransferase